MLTEKQILAAADSLLQQVKYDIEFAYQRARTFAEKQRETLIDFEVEISAGLFAGQEQIPMRAAGCYIPGGRYAHIASAIISVAAAKAAGVEHVVACSPPKPGAGEHPAIAYTILALGGVPGIAAMAFGLFTGHPADIHVHTHRPSPQHNRLVLGGVRRHPVG